MKSYCCGNTKRLTRLALVLVVVVGCFSLSQAFWVCPLVETTFSRKTVKGTTTAPSKLRQYYGRSNAYHLPPLPGVPDSAKDNEEPSQGQSKTSFLVTLDKAGLSLKPKALQASSKMSLSDRKGQKLMYLVKTCFYYSLFLLYRAYRGFFVILPAVFREVYRKLEGSVDSPFEAISSEEDEVTTLETDNTKTRWRTRITVSCLAGIVTASYVVGGAWRVLLRFVKTMTQTSSVPTSFAAAVQEQETNEEKFLRYANKRNAINGQQSSSSSSSSGLAP